MLQRRQLPVAKNPAAGKHSGLSCLKSSSTPCYCPLLLLLPVTFTAFAVTLSSVMEVPPSHPLIRLPERAAQGELADAMEGGGGGNAAARKGPAFTREELRALFSYDAAAQCETARIMAHSATSASGADWQARGS